MKTIKSVLIELNRDEDGASFLEYTVLLGIILAVAVTVVFAIGEYAGNIWSYLCNTGLKKLTVGTANTEVTGSCQSIAAALAAG